MGIEPDGDDRVAPLQTPLHVAVTDADSEARPRGLGAAEVRALAARHGIRPSRSFGQNFLIDPNLARAIVADAGIGPGDRVVEVGAGLGSLTVALASAASEVVAVEADRAVVPALREAVDGLPVRVVEGDALGLDWADVLPGRPWRMVSNLPYNVAVPVVFGMLEEAPQVADYVVMVQREVGERLAAGPGSDAYGAASARLAYLAEVGLVRRVPASVFWPKPKVESVLVRIVPRSTPPVAAPRDALFRVIEAGFAQRRKTMRNALTRLGVDASRAAALLRECGLSEDVRAEQLGLTEFACLAGAVR
jgi:16S rRNA (adenine1518-N6/adenine1519-N6)-dimethyltransferase